MSSQDELHPEDNPFVSLIFGLNELMPQTAFGLIGVDLYCFRCNRRLAPLVGTEPK